MSDLQQILKEYEVQDLKTVSNIIQKEIMEGLGY